jgi:hypothetical protein
MLPQRLDMLLAFKALALAEDLTATQKRVAVTIVDSFNRQTAQCDPSLNRIAYLLGVSRRTVIRAVATLEKRRLVIKTRHGGKSHRNAYEPNWPAFREIERCWTALKATRHWQAAPSDMTPLTVTSECQFAGDADGTQTNPNKSSHLTLPASGSKNGTPTGAGLIDRKWHSEKELRAKGTSPSRSMPELGASLAAARVSAEKKWNAQLHALLVGNVDLYAGAIDALDPELQQAATDAELQRDGAGVLHVIEELSRRGLRL